jgi:hypothetical protein
VVLATHNDGLPLMLPKERIVLERGRMVERFTAEGAEIAEIRQDPTGLINKV